MNLPFFYLLPQGTDCPAEMEFDASGDILTPHPPPMIKKFNVFLAYGVSQAFGIILSSFPLQLSK